jgi:flavin reductase (DIM6/NTAB) family NADH-FMN oxidoreductase RutF
MRMGNGNPCNPRVANPLQERTRERAPLDWAQSSGNHGRALRVLAERRGDLAMAEQALAQFSAAVLIDALGAIECRVTSIVEQGDHHIIVGEVVEAHLNTPPSGRPDAAILEMKDLGDNVFYGG